MSQRKSWVVLAVAWAAGCAGGGDDGTAMTKDEARRHGGKADDGTDWCDKLHWYGDGVCDDFCPRPDPDCEVQEVTCGGFAGLPCPEGLVCVDDPTDGCDPDHGGADCGGICVANGGGGAGAGEPCGGHAGITCGEDLFCDYARDDICGASDHMGTCAAVPEACTEEYAPVCGCDGHTHGNECSAHAAGTAVASDGECAGGGAGEGEGCGGFAGLTCAEGLFCDYAREDICGGADAMGTCAAVPEVCTEEYAPVCGCNGQTYGNECSAHAAGTAVATDGACAATDCRESGCDTGDYCTYCWGNWACIPEGAVC